MNSLNTTLLLSLLTILMGTMSSVIGGAMMSLFPTRPPMEERIARLESPANRTY